eukprot:11205875-Lingulodinium_polyedra.AAC.1
MTVMMTVMAVIVIMAVIVRIARTVGIARIVSIVRIVLVFFYFPMPRFTIGNEFRPAGVFRAWVATERQLRRWLGT